MKVHILLLAGLLLILACNMDSFLYNEKPIDKYTLPGNTIPDSLLQLVKLTSGNSTIYGYWVKSNGERPGITILYCHGNKYHIDNYWDRVMLLHNLGANVFIFDYRGFGMSSGVSTEASLYQDGEAALNFVLAKKVSPDSLCIYGYSLGNVVSIYLTAERISPLCLIAEAPFASANSLTQGSVVLDIPALWLTKGEYNNADRIKKIDTHFLLIHGDKDDFVRFRDNGQIVYNNAPEPKRLELVKGANHTNIPLTMGTDNYMQLLKYWIFTKKYIP